MPTIYQSNGIWCVKYYWNGKRYTKSLSTTNRAKAERLADDIDRALKQKKKELTAEAANGYVDSVGTLAALYLDYVEGYHRGERRNIVKRVIHATVRHSGTLPLVEFGPKRLKSLRDTWVKAGHRRPTCNDYTGIVKHMFAWGVEEELIPETVYRALVCVKNLQAGRTAAPENSPRSTVSRETVYATLAHLPRTLKAMVLFQYWTGARPGEIFGLTIEDIDRSRDIWVANVREHKNQWRGKVRRLVIPKQAQEPLKELLLEAEPGTPIFSPERAMKERWAARPTHRRTPLKGEYAYRDRYDKDSYRKAVLRACDRAGVERWTPYQLRHTAATEIEAESGELAAKAVLGHASLKTTQIYLHADLESAVEAARNRR